MIEAAKERVPDANFACLDLLADEFNEEHDYVFCGATIQNRPRYGDPEEYLQQMVRKMFSLTKRALAFDVFSSRVDYVYEGNLYTDPFDLLSFCYTLSNRLAIRNDHRPYEIIVYLYKLQTKTKMNMFTHWEVPAPRIVGEE